MVVLPLSLAMKADHSISRRLVFDMTLDTATARGSANSLKRCEQKLMNSFTATWNLRAPIKCGHEKFAAPCGPIRFTLQSAQLVANELRPLVQDRNIDELVQHFSRGTPHRFII